MPAAISTGCVPSQAGHKGRRTGVGLGWPLRSPPEPPPRAAQWLAGPKIRARGRLGKKGSLQSSGAGPPKFATNYEGVFGTGKDLLANPSKSCSTPWDQLPSAILVLSSGSREPVRKCPAHPPPPQPFRAAQHPAFARMTISLVPSVPCSSISSRPVRRTISSRPTPRC
jgi:hypothetical protein